LVADLVKLEGRADPSCSEVEKTIEAVQMHVTRFTMDPTSKHLQIELSQQCAKDNEVLESTQEALYRLLPLTVATDATVKDDAVLFDCEFSTSTDFSLA
jgi:hypothetical protein